MATWSLTGATLPAIPTKKKRKYPSFKNTLCLGIPWYFVKAFIVDLCNLQPITILHSYFCGAKHSYQSHKLCVLSNPRSHHSLSLSLSLSFLTISISLSLYLSLFLTPPLSLCLPLSLSLSLLPPPLSLSLQEGKPGKIEMWTTEKHSKAALCWG